MIFFLFGICLIFLMIPLNVGGEYINLIPAFLGYLVIAIDAHLMRYYSKSYITVKFIAIIMTIISTIYYATDIFLGINKIDIIFITQLILTLLIIVVLIFLYIKGISDVEKLIGYDFESAKIKKTFYILIIIGTVIYFSFILITSYFDLLNNAMVFMIFWFADIGLIIFFVISMIKLIKYFSYASKGFTEYLRLRKLAEYLKMQMPELIDEMKNKVLANIDNREFILLSDQYADDYKIASMAYCFENYPELEQMIKIIEENKLIFDISYDNVKKYKMDEDFIEILSRYV